MDKFSGFVGVYRLLLKAYSLEGRDEKWDFGLPVRMKVPLNDNFRNQVNSVYKKDDF